MSIRNLFLTGVLLFSATTGRTQVKAGEKAPGVIVTQWIQNAPDPSTLVGKFTSLKKRTSA